VNTRPLLVVDEVPVTAGARERALADSTDRAHSALQSPAQLATRWRIEKRFALHVPVDDDVVVDAPARTAPACETCADPCCARANAIVSLRLTDVARLVDNGLARALVEPRALLARFPALANEIAGLGERDSFSRAFVLDKRDDGTCVFFERGKCTIHDVKPLVCRAFPFQLDETRARVRWASSCESKRAGRNDDTRAGVSAAIASYRAKVNDVVTRAFAHDDVADLMPHAPAGNSEGTDDDGSG
jgi:Fe-S-cluster containining protein